MQIPPLDINKQKERDGAEAKLIEKEKATAIGMVIAFFIGGRLEADIKFAWGFVRQVAYLKRRLPCSAGLPSASAVTFFFLPKDFITLYAMGAAQ